MQYWLLKFFIFIVCFITIEKLCHKATDGFQLQKILSDFSFDQQWETDSCPQELLSAFDQPFYFLGSGGQCYAFLSEDKNYVIKFFKQHHMRKLPWLEKVVLPAFLDKYRQKILADRAKRSQERIFGSYKIAYDYLKEETGFINLHLNKTDSIHKNLIIFDKLGIAHTIDLDNTEFALQKYATLSFRHLRNLIKQHKLPEVKECLDSLFRLLIKRTKLRIVDQDPVFRKNFGFIGNTAIEIDLGSFTWEEKSSTDNYQKTLFEESLELKKWLAKRCPQLVDYFNAQLYETISSY